MKKTASIKETFFSKGPDKGLKCFEISGAGLRFSLIPEYALDIGPLTLDDIPISYYSREGYQGSHNPNGKFAGGMLMTCGLENTGPSCEIDGKQYLQHGTLRFCTAKNVTYQQNGHLIEVKGIIESGPFSMYRTICFDANERTISLRDKITNISKESQYCFLMYHINFGKPFLSVNNNISIPIEDIFPKNADAEAHIEIWDSFFDPEHNCPPRVFFIKPQTGEAMIANPDLGISVKLRFDLLELPRIDVWKLFKPDEYVVSFEPCLEFAFGRKKIIEEGLTVSIQPGASINAGVSLKFAVE